jgi:hypothetical protein
MITRIGLPALLAAAGMITAPVGGGIAADGTGMALIGVAAIAGLSFPARGSSTGTDQAAAEGAG